MQLTKKCPKPTYRKDSVYYFSKAVPKNLLDLCHRVGAPSRLEARSMPADPPVYLSSHLAAAGSDCEVKQVMTVIWRSRRVEKKENLFVNSRIDHSLWGVYGSQTREPSGSGAVSSGCDPFRLWLDH